MKKLFFFLILLFMPFIVLAVDPDYEVEGYFAIHKINEDGTITVKEAIVLNGDMNGYEREILTSNSNLSSGKNINFEHDAIYNPTAVSNVKVAAYKVKKDELNYEIVNKDFKYSELNYNARKGARNKYTLTDSNNQYVIKNYYSCSNCRIAFYFEYDIEGATVIHEDTAEVYLQLFTHNYVTENMGMIDMEVVLPEHDEDSLMWVHGNVYGNVEKADTQKWLIHSDKFPKGSELDYRTVFNKDLIIENSSIKHTSVEALPSIKEIEKRRTEERAKEIARILKYIKAMKYIGYGYLAILIVLLIIMYFKYDREHNVSFYSKYYREFIDDYDVEVVDYLFNKRITPNAMSASIMNLIYKKKIKAEPVSGKKDEYLFTLLEENEISHSEQLLIDFLFKEVGDGQTFTTKKLKDYAKSTKTYEKFTNSYNAWSKSVTSEGESQEFFEDNKSISMRVLVGLYLLLGFFIFVISVITIDEFIFNDLLLIPIAFTFIYLFTFTKRTEKGALHHKKWQAFKNFLNDFGKFDIKELPEIILWERYLVYATVLGIADKVQKTMNVKISEAEKIGSFDTTPFLYYHSFSSFGNVVSQSIQQAHNLAVSTAAAQNSANYGGGGGFSGGGGFGGGGGGGHGF